MSVGLHVRVNDDGGDGNGKYTVYLFIFIAYMIFMV